MENCIWMEGLVGDSWESFGDLDSILCSIIRNKVDSMVNIDRGKLWWTASSRFLKVRTLLGMKPKDGSNPNTCTRSNRTNRMASIKLREDDILLSSREGSHDHNGWESRSVATFSDSDIVLICISLSVASNNINYPFISLRSYNMVHIKSPKTISMWLLF